MIRQIKAGYISKETGIETFFTTAIPIHILHQKSTQPGITNRFRMPFESTRI